MPKPGYKKTELGELPEEWEVVRLGDEEIADLIMGQSPPSSSYNKEGNGMPFFQGNINFGSKYPSSPDVYTTKPMKIAEAGDILISVRAPVGEVNISKFRVCIGRGLAAIRCHKEKLESDYLFYWLKHNSHILKIKGAGSTFKAITKKDLENLKIPLPPLPEQRRIAKVLRTVDEGIEKTEEEIARTERLKKGLMQELLTKGIGHEKFKKTEIGEIPEKWVVVRLKRVSNEITIGVVSSATPYYTSSDEGVPYFRSQNVKENKLLPTDIYVTRDFNMAHKKSILKEGDVLTVQTGDIGTSCVVPKEYDGANCHSLIITRPNKQLLDSYFLSYFLNSTFGKNEIMRINAGWGRNHLLLQDFRNLKIPLPPLEEQRKIAEILRTVDERLELLRERKENQERVKKGLMNDLLTGRRRVPEGEV